MTQSALLSTIHPKPLFFRLCPPSGWKPEGYSVTGTLRPPPGQSTRSGRNLRKNNAQDGRLGQSRSEFARTARRFNGPRSLFTHATGRAAQTRRVDKCLVVCRWRSGLDARSRSSIGGKEVDWLLHSTCAWAGSLWEQSQENSI